MDVLFHFMYAILGLMAVNFLSMNVISNLMNFIFHAVEVISHFYLHYA